MKRIMKYQLSFHGEQVLTMPGRAYPLSVGAQNGRIFLWMLAYDDEAEARQAHTIRILGNGSRVPENLSPINFVGTVQVAGVDWHVFVEEAV